MAARKRCQNIPAGFGSLGLDPCLDAELGPNEASSMSLACSFIGSTAHPWQTVWAGFTMEICLSIGKKAEKSDLISPHSPWNEATFQGFIKITPTDVITLISVSGFSAVIWFLRANAPERSQVYFHLRFFLPCTKHDIFREVWNVWWMLPTAECTPIIILMQRHFISVFNFFNEILHQGL